VHHNSAASVVDSFYQLEIMLGYGACYRIKFIFSFLELVEVLDTFCFYFPNASITLKIFFLGFENGCGITKCSSNCFAWTAPMLGIRVSDIWYWSSLLIYG